MDLVARFHRDLGQTVLVITHNEQVAGRADRLLRMRDGRLL
jgi:putative ABC transport system ATP-binding protein